MRSDQGSDNRDGAARERLEDRDLPDSENHAAEEEVRKRGAHARCGAYGSPRHNQVDAYGDRGGDERRRHRNLWRHDRLIARPAHDHVACAEEHGGYQREDDADELELGGPRAFPADRCPTGDDQDRAEADGESERLVQEHDCEQR